MFLIEHPACCSGKCLTCGRGKKQIHIKGKLYIVIWEILSSQSGQSVPDDDRIISVAMTSS
jgi:hypothetical protein